MPTPAILALTQVPGRFERVWGELCTRPRYEGTVSSDRGASPLKSDYRRTRREGVSLEGRSPGNHGMKETLTFADQGALGTKSAPGSAKCCATGFC